MKRSALSLTEVLISMGILTLGLLGVASVFPVASYYMTKAEVYDVSSSAGQAVMSDLLTRGMLDPRAWYLETPAPTSNTLGDPNYAYTGIDGNYAPGATVKATSFTRPFAETLDSALKTLEGGLSQAKLPAALDAQMGCAYCIDPIGVAAVQRVAGVNAGARVMYGFPSASFMAYPGKGGTYYSTSGWDIWRANTTPPNNPTQMTWPIRRVTFRETATGWNLDKTIASHYCSYQEDLSYEMPTRDDRPSAGLWEVAATTGTPLARKWKGDYSWIATVVPHTSADRDLMATNPLSAMCDVSVVILYKRELPSDAFLTTSDYPNAISPERSVGASIISTSLNGGEVLLRDLGDGVSSPFANLKAGSYMLLCGPHPNSSASAPKFTLNWYQIITIEKDLNSIITDADKQRVVTLRGPEWPWQPAPTNIHDYSQLSNDLCAGIIKGAVAVHTKSMAMQNTVRAGLPTLGATGTPQGANEAMIPH